MAGSIGTCSKAGLLNGADKRGSPGVSDEAAKGVNNEVTVTGADNKIVGAGADDEAEVEAEAEAEAAAPRADDKVTGA
jgi:hypothetical protein